MDNMLGAIERLACPVFRNRLCTAGCEMLCGSWRIFRKAVPRYPPRLASIRQDHMQNKAVSGEGENVERNLWFLFEFFVQPGDLTTQRRKLGQNLHVDLFVQR